MPTDLFSSRSVFSLSVPKIWSCRPCSATLVPAGRGSCFNVRLVFKENRGTFCCLQPFCNFQMKGPSQLPEPSISKRGWTTKQNRFLYLPNCYYLESEIVIFLIFFPARTTIIAALDSTETTLWFMRPPEFRVAEYHSFLLLGSFECCHHSYPGNNHPGS